MSERMIEIQREKMGLPPMAAAAAPAMTASPQSTPTAGVAGLMNVQPSNAPAARPTPQQAAAAAMFAEEKELQIFLQKIQRRDDNMSSEKEGGPTVPTALARRMLQTQGVGYLDETVSAVASASADRFLATVLQQAVACRDQRLKGAELEREHSRKRRRHLKQYKEDADDRQRRKLARDEARRKSNLAAIEAANNLAKTGTVSAATSPTKSKKKKKTTDASGGENGNKKPNTKNDDEVDDEASEDSLDDEEAYYDEFYGEDSEEEDASEALNEDEEDETRYTLLLRDFARPLEAWGVHLTGKLGFEAAPLASSDDEESDDDDSKADTENAEQIADVGNENGETPPSPTAPGKVTKSPTSGNHEKKPEDLSGGGASAYRAATPVPTKSPATVPKPP